MKYIQIIFAALADTTNYRWALCDYTDI